MAGKDKLNKITLIAISLLQVCWEYKTAIEHTVHQINVFYQWWNVLWTKSGISEEG